MGNPDLVIVFNGGQLSFLILGQDYNSREEAIQKGIEKYIKYWDNFAEFKEQNETKSINIYEIIDM